MGVAKAKVNEEQIKVKGKMMTKVKRNRQNYPVVTITRRKIVFDKFCVDNIVGESNFISLYRDADDKTLAIKFYGDDDDQQKDIYVIKKLNVQGRPYYFSTAYDFVKSLGRKKEIKRARYKGEWDSENNVLIIDLDKALSETLVLFK